MTTHDQACFEWWYENAATAAERELPYEKQVEAHIYWLSGLNGIHELLERMPKPEHAQ